MDTQALVERAVEAIRRGAPVLLPTDTVYGLCASAFDGAAAERAYGVERREGAQPLRSSQRTSTTLLATLPELDDRSARIVRELLPGPYTLVLPNPARRFAWLTGERPDTVGVRVANRSRGDAARPGCGRRGTRDERECPRRSVAGDSRRGA